jgi:hypothetical protein
MGLVELTCNGGATRASGDGSINMYEWCGLLFSDLQMRKLRATICGKMDFFFIIKKIKKNYSFQRRRITVGKNR